MIPKRAIEEYLARPIESLAWIKELSEKEIDHELSFVKPKPQFTAPLRKEQKACFLLGLADPGLVYMLDLGLGKTVISLELLSYFYQHKFIRQAFVFCSSNELVEGWQDELVKWGFSIPYLCLKNSSSKDKWEKFDNFTSGIIIGTYVGIAAMVSQVEDVYSARTDTTKRKRVVKKELLDKLSQRADACVYDQSTKIGNHLSLSSKVCLKFSNRAQINFALAGRAFGRDPVLLFNQFRLADKGKAFGRYIGLFREAFYRRESQTWGDKWVLRKRREKLLAEFCTASSLRYGAEECQQLPERIHIIKECSLSSETWFYYDKLRTELLQSKGNYREIKSTFLRMRQISSGFVGLKDDETGEKAQIEFDDNPKLELLMEVVEELPPDKKMIIFHEFTWSGSKICQQLAKRKIKHGWLWSGTKDWTKIKDAYNKDSDFKVLVANWKKGSMGLNLQNGNYTVFYESPVPVVDRAECEGRQRRTGQKNTCFVIDLVVKDTVDEDVLGFHKEGGVLWDRIINKFQGQKKKKRVKL